MRETHQSIRLIHLLPFSVLLPLLVACAPCQEVRQQYLADLEANIGTTNPSSRQQDQLVVSLSEGVVQGATAELERRWIDAMREAVPRTVELPLMSPIRTETGVEITDLELFEVGSSAGVRIGVRASISLQLPGRSGRVDVGVTARGQLETVVGISRDGQSSRVLLRAGQSELTNLDIDLTGLARRSRLGRQVTNLLEDLVREVFRPEVLRQLGNVEIAEIEPIRVGETTIELSMSSLRVDAASGYLDIGLVTNLDLDQRVSIPRTRAGADVDVRMSAVLAKPLLNAVLGADGGLRFNSRGDPDPEGPYTLMIDRLDTATGELDFAYRIYRCARPCLFADFAGHARLGLRDGAPSLVVDRHHLVDAMRYRNAVEARQPEAEELSTALTDLLNDVLTFEALSLPGGSSVELQVEGLEVQPDGFLVGWALGGGTPSGAFGASSP